MSRRLIIPSAEAEFLDIGQCYGIRQDIDDWCRQVTAEAHRPQRPMTGASEVPIEQVIAKLELESAAPDSPWIMELSHFLDMHKDDVANLKGRLAKRKPPWQVRRNSRIFDALGGSVEVDVQVIYDINSEDGTVTFLWFGAYKPDPPAADAGATDTPKPWR